MKQKAVGPEAGDDGENADNLLLHHNESPTNLSVFKQSLTFKVYVGQEFEEGLSWVVVVQVFHSVALRYDWSMEQQRADVAGASWTPQSLHVISSVFCDVSAVG